MPDTFVKVEGLADLEKALAELPKATARAALNRTLTKGGDFLLDVLQSVTPRLTGHLERSETVGKRLTRRQARERKQDGKDFAEIYVGTSDPAGVQLEYGNANQAATPFFRPAWDASKDHVLGIISTELGGEIEKSRARLARKAARLAAKG